jgi:hypothetical protein
VIIHVSLIVVMYLSVFFPCVYGCYVVYDLDFMHCVHDIVIDPFTQILHLHFQQMICHIDSNQYFSTTQSIMI